MRIHRLTILTVILAGLLVPFAFGYTGPVNNTASIVNDTRVDPNATIAFTVGPLLNGTTDNPVQNGFGMSFDGVLDGVTIAHAASINITGNYTFSAWYKKLSNQTGFRTATLKGVLGNDRAFCILQRGTDVGTPNIVQVQHGTGGGFTSLNLVVSLNRWYFITITYDGNIFYLYVNGTLSTQTAGGVAPLSGNNGALVYASSVDDLNCELDEITLFNRSLGPGEISYLFNNKVPLDQTGLVLWTDFDTNVLDQSPEGNDGTINGNPQYVRGIRGKADMVFDGTDDYVNFGSAAELDNMGSYAYEFWFTPELSANAMILSKQFSYIQLRTTGQIRAAITSTGNDALAYSNNNAIVSGTQYHFILNYDNSSLNRWPRLYLNGAEISYGFNQNATGALSDDSGGTFYLGAEAPGATKYNGTADELRIYNRTLTAKEIIEHYQGTYLNETGLVLHANLDGDVLDSSGEGNNGVINGDPEHGDGLADVPVFTSINGRCSLANSTTGLMTLIQDAPATPANYTNINVYPVTNSVLNATVPLLQVDLYNIDVGALYTEVEATFQTLLFANGSSVLDGHQLTQGDTLIINGVTFTWSTFTNRFEATTSSAIAAIITFDTLTSLVEQTYSITNGNITSAPTVVWTTPKLDLLLPFMRVGDWPGAILQINYILMGETIFWTFFLTIISIAIYNHSGAEPALLSWMFGWSMFSAVLHEQALTISLILMAIGGGIYIAKFFLDRRTTI